MVTRSPQNIARVLVWTPAAAFLWNIQVKSFRQPDRLTEAEQAYLGAWVCLLPFAPPFLSALGDSMSDHDVHFCVGERPKCACTVSDRGGVLWSLNAGPVNLSRGESTRGWILLAAFLAMSHSGLLMSHSGAWT